MEARVHGVSRVTFHIDKSSPARIVVHALGEVNTSGWRNGRLILRSNPAKDGSLDFDFVAESPQGLALEVMSVVEGLGESVLDDKVKRIRVHASSNVHEVGLAVPSVAAFQGTISDLLPWPWRRKLPRT